MINIYEVVKNLLSNLVGNSGGHEIAGHKNGWPKTKDDYEEFWANNQAMEFYYDNSRLAFFNTVFVKIKDKLRGDIADIGCGDGYFLEYISNNIEKYKKGRKLSGVDYAESALRKLKFRLPKANTYCSDVKRLPFENEKYQAVLLMETLEHVDEWKTVLCECLRILKKDGFLIITIPNGKYDKWEGHTNFWNESEFDRILKSLKRPYEFIFLEEGRTLMAIVNK